MSTTPLNNYGALIPRSLWVLMVVLVGSPLVLIGLLGLVDLQAGTIAGPSLMGYLELAKPYRIGEIMRVVARSLLLGVTASGIGFVVSFYLVQYFSSRSQSLFLLLLTLPFLVNEAVRTFAWTTLLQRGGPFNQVAAWFGGSPETFSLASNYNVYVVLTLNLIPFAIFICTLALKTIDQNIWLAAKEMGASVRTLFWKIMLPLGKQGFFFSWLVTAFFALSMTTEVNFLGGATKLSIPNLISNLQSANNIPAVFSLGTVFLLTALALFSLIRLARP